MPVAVTDAGPVAVQRPIFVRSDKNVIVASVAAIT